MKKFAKSVDDYIASFPEEVQSALNIIRGIIKSSAPGAVENIAYGMPAYKLRGKPLVYFAAFEKHIGFYPTPSGVSEFELELSKYKQGKGSIQFPLNAPIPFDLIEKIVKFRTLESNPGPTHKSDS